MAGMVSCTKMLDIDNPNEPIEADYWKSGADALAGVNAIYGSTYRNGTFARWLAVYFNPRSDDGMGTSGWGELRAAADFTMSDYNFEAARNIFDHHYRGIYRTNQVLTFVPAIQMDETLKKRYLAEAKFFRAIYYFNLVTLWGNVPLVLTPQKPTDLPPQAPQSETWAQIEKDLTEAVPDLPVSYGNAELGRVTKGAAYALLGKVYLQQHKYQPAADAFNWLVEGEGKSLYDLTEDYRDNFLHTTENNKESVFEIQFKAQQSTTDEDAPNSNMGNQLGNFFAPPNGPGYNDMEMRRWVIDEFMQEKTLDNKRDPRLESTAIFDYMDERGPNFTTVYGRVFSQFLSPSDQRVWYRKYLNDYFLTAETYEGPINFRVIRYADVLLMYAECLNQLNRTADAYQYVDRVRQRVNLAKLSDVRPGLNKDQFQSQLMHERVMELTGEQVRWTDLSRWGYFDDQAKLNQLKARDPEFNNFVLGKHKYLPIPQSEIDINPNLVQNPGW